MYVLNFSGEMCKEEFKFKTHDEALAELKNKTGLLNVHLRTTDNIHYYVFGSQVACIKKEYLTVNIRTIDFESTTRPDNYMVFINGICKSSITIHGWRHSYEAVILKKCLQEYMLILTEHEYTQVPADMLLSYNLIGIVKESGIIKIVKDVNTIFGSDIMLHHYNEVFYTISLHERWVRYDTNKELTFHHNGSKFTISEIEQAMTYFKERYLV